MKKLICCLMIFFLQADWKLERVLWNMLTGWNLGQFRTFTYSSRKARWHDDIWARCGRHDYSHYSWDCHRKLWSIQISTMLWWINGFFWIRNNCYLSSAAVKQVVKMKDANAKLTRIYVTVDITIVYHAKINNFT